MKASRPPWFGPARSPHVSVLWRRLPTGAQVAISPEAKRRSRFSPMVGRNEDMELVKEGIKQQRALKRSTTQTARSYIEDAPDLIVLPERAEGLKSRRAEDQKIRKAEMKLPRAEAERIEAEAAKMKVLEFKPRDTAPYVSDTDHYEDCIERECNGEGLPLEEMEFMRAFEKTQAYRDLEQRFTFLRDLYLAGPETEEAP